MTKIILCGCSGHMGHVVTEIAAADAEVEIVAGIDLSGTKDASYPVFASLKDCDVKADALIDFFIPEALDAILTHCMEKTFRRFCVRPVIQMRRWSRFVRQAKRSL